MVQWETQGKLKCRETHYKGIESFYTAFIGLFTGDNVGKSVLDLAPV